MKWRLAAMAVVLLLAGAYLAARRYALVQAEHGLMELHPKGAATPATYGVAFQEVTIPSGGRRLDAYLVRAPAACDRPPAVLIFHGRGETVSDWARAQAFLSGVCISSLVFDYSGHGSSSPPATIANLNEDSGSAYRVFAALFPRPTRRCLLAHSMGNAPMLVAYPRMAPAPDCVVAANAFTSVAGIGAAEGAPRALLFLVSGLWDNTAAIRAVRAPLLVIHSDADRVVPPAMGASLAAAAPAGAMRVTVHCFGHNAVYEQPEAGWWTPVTAFVRPLAGARPSH